MKSVEELYEEFKVAHKAVKLALQNECRVKKSIQSLFKREKLSCVENGDSTIESWFFTVAGEGTFVTCRRWHDGVVAVLSTTPEMEHEMVKILLEEL